jgi:hypothetical protein
MDSEVPFTNLLRCNHHWPFCHVPTPTRLTLTNLTLIPIIMRNLTILFPVIRTARAVTLALRSADESVDRVVETTRQLFRLRMLWV